ncbi:class I SAM-dependent methyltransferase [uncultured Maritalea sp.]|jgi:SAM-dependent methyltransferase|uniref:class I SAM-dependent methyltransferase n=1 Tax=uncultured Maritalea sp. TaxID=757249 RepID=UPI00260F2AA5|nr:methyltransferase domain-containing protein [uncultured Maritalea sp.]
MDQSHLSEINQFAWEDSAYQAWVKKYGRPKTAAAQIRADPHFTARRILPYLGDPAGARIANPLGSHGRVATALSLLGADVSVFDISNSNAKYGLQLARAAGVSLDYVVGDFIESAESHTKQYDATIMELGVLHYFVSLEAFVAALKRITKPSGLIILVDFHPLLKKALSVANDKVHLEGNYFSNVAEVADTPYAQILRRRVPTCLIRRWNMSEIINAFLDSELTLSHFAEHPADDCAQLPGTFTLVAQRTA